MPKAATTNQRLAYESDPVRMCVCVCVCERERERERELSVGVGVGFIRRVAHTAHKDKNAPVGPVCVFVHPVGSFLEVAAGLSGVEDGTQTRRH